MLEIAAQNPHILKINQKKYSKNRRSGQLRSGEAEEMVGIAVLKSL